MSQVFQPGFHVDPTRVKLSAHWEAGGNELLPVELLRNEGSAFLLSIDGRPPVWAWLHDPELVTQLFEWFVAWGVAHYDDRHGLLKVWSGAVVAITCPRMAAPGQRIESGEFLADVMRRSVGALA